MACLMSDSYGNCIGVHSSLLLMDLDRSSAAAMIGWSPDFCAKTTKAVRRANKATPLCCIAILVV